jgi:hypothetical protein
MPSHSAGGVQTTIGKREGFMRQFGQPCLQRFVGMIWLGLIGFATLRRTSPQKGHKQKSRSRWIGFLFATD